MSEKHMDPTSYNGCKNINELMNHDCMPLLDMLLKLSGIASNFASAANNAKNISVTDKHEIEELMDLVFDIRKLAEKVEKLVEERIDNNFIVIRSGIFEKIAFEEQQRNLLGDIVKAGTDLNKILEKCNKDKNK